ncbi:MAG TPA: TonB-dependent receptor [Candidatus Polarisedimenticolia bacterium]|nr:TonB-dependent receptor [Candidatus Polarisedimenticolia bacterium]
MRRLFVLLLVLGLCAVWCGRAAAQEVTGSILGTVTDSKGGVVPNAKVTITNTDRQVVVRTLTTDDRGQYVAPLLPIGQYSVTVEIAGFKKLTQSGVTLNVNDKLPLNFKLEVGAVSETVSVEADALHVDTQSVVPTGLITGTQMRELSLGTRNYEQLVSLMPGVSMGNLNQLYIGNSLPSGLAATVSFSINGQRNGSNYWTIDGIDNVDRGSNLTLSNFPSVDAISEFKVLRSEYDAEFGRAGGGIINVATKSGGNTFHGNAYEFFRNDVLAANNFFNNAATPQVKRPPLRYNDFGYTIGGPVFIPNHYSANKDKTFFFFSEEFRRVITYSTFSANVPTAGMLGGNFQNNVCVAFNGTTCTANSNTIASFNSAATAYIKDFYSKFPGANNTASSIFSLVTAQRNIFNGRQEVIRGDHVFNSKLSMFGRYEHDSIPTQEPGGLFTGAVLPGVATTSTNSPGWQAMGHYTYTMRSNLLNDGGYGFNYSAIISDPIGLELKSQSPDVVSAITLPFASTLNRVPAVLISGISTITGFGSYRDYNRDHNVFDNMTWIKGKHTLKFGGSYHHYQKAENAGGNNVGSFSFPTTGAPTGANCVTTAAICSTEQAWANFLLGNIGTFTQSSQDAKADIREHQFEVYGQDEFRMAPRLTLTLGLRYSWFNQPTSGNGQLNNFDTQLFDPAKAPTISTTGQLCLVTACPGGGTPNPNFDPLNGFIIADQNSPFGLHISNTDNKNFAPRIGIAWDPFGDGKTAVRMGYGIFYDATLVGTFEQNVFNDPPFTTSVSIARAPFTNPSGGNLNISANPPAFGGSGSAAFISLPWHTPYTQQWSLDVQRQLKKDMLVDVGYYGNNSHHLLGVVDINQVQPGVGVANGLNPANFTSTAGELPLNRFRPFLGYGAISGIQNRFNSNYHSLQAQFQKRWGANSLFVFNYTWSHNLTNNPSDRSNAPQNTYNIGAEYGRSSLDRRQNVTASYVYDLPWYKPQAGLVGHVLGGWEVSGLVYYYTGTPLTVTTSNTDPGGLGLLGASASSARPDITGNPNQGALHTVASFFNTSVFVPTPVNANRPGTAGRGVVTGPSFQRWDVSLFKNTKLRGEHMYVQFRAETFNVFNHTNFSAVGTNITLSTFGKVTTANDPRILQLGLKLYY